MVVLNRKFILRYLILTAILVICAGAAWFLTNTARVPSEDAVLARLSERTEENGKTEKFDTSRELANRIISEWEAYSDGE